MGHSRERLPRPGEVRPSIFTDEFWLWVHNPARGRSTLADKVGKWLIFVPVAEIDDVWARIAAATEEGLLGGCSKVATARPNRNASDPNKRVICVFTDDWTDAEDVRRVRRQLRELGIVEPISYKSDEDTRAGHYSNRGHQRIAKYRE